MVDLELLKTRLNSYARPPRFDDYVAADLNPDILAGAYYCVEMIVDFYDDEPDFPSEWDGVAEYWANPDFKRQWRYLQEEHEPIRLAKCTWQEPYFKGNWGMTQEFVNEKAFDTLRFFHGLGRTYVAAVDNTLYIYCYARDLPNEHRDYQIILKEL